MVRILWAIIFSLSLVSGIDLGKVVDDEVAEYHEISHQDLHTFLRSFKNSRLTFEEARLINETCRRYNLDVIASLARAQGEQGVIINLTDKNYRWRHERFFSYGLTITDSRGNCPYLGFSNQVTNALARIRQFTDEWKPGMKAWVDFYGWVTCRNAATYALHRYNPRWGAASNMGVYNIGNSLFITILAEFRSYWLSFAGSK